jgi:hypothetical protein
MTNNKNLTCYLDLQLTLLLWSKQVKIIYASVFLLRWPKGGPTASVLAKKLYV